MIEIRNLVKRFGTIAAVNGISFSVRKGEVLGFLGPNGAGKSTTMKMITGYLAPTSGEIGVMDKNVATEPIEAQRLIGYLPEGAPAYGDMTPRQFLAFVANVRGLEQEARAKALARAVGLTELAGVLEQPIETLSKGFKRRVGLAQAILHDPPVLIMDEPTDGLDPNQKHQVRGLIAQMAEDKAIIISTHILEEVDAVCSRALIIDHGRIVADGTPSELMARSRYHNAVTVIISEAQAELARQVFRLQTGAQGHEERPTGTDRIAFTLIARPGRQIAESLMAALHERKVDVLEFSVDPGRLDEVFRTLTSLPANEPSAAEHVA